PSTAIATGPICPSARVVTSPPHRDTLLTTPPESFCPPRVVQNTSPSRTAIAEVRVKAGRETEAIVTCPASSGHRSSTHAQLALPQGGEDGQGTGAQVVVVVVVVLSVSTVLSYSAEREPHDVRRAMERARAGRRKGALTPSRIAAVE